MQISIQNYQAIQAKDGAFRLEDEVQSDGFGRLRVNLQQSTTKEGGITLQTTSSHVHIQTALQANEDPRVFAKMTVVFCELSNNHQFVETFAKWLIKLNEIGVEFTLEYYLKSR